MPEDLESPSQQAPGVETVAAPAAPLRVRVLSFNAYIAPGISAELDERLAVVGSKIAALEPDVVALQEVWHVDHAAKIAADLAEAGLVHAYWVARGGAPPLGSSGLLTASVFPIERIAFVPYAVGGVPPIALHADWMANKGVLMLRVQTPIGPVDIANTHLHSSYVMHDHLAVRTGQAVELVEALAKTWPEDDVRPPLIVAGDFNSRPESLPMRLLEARGGLAVAAPGYDIDAVLLRPGAEVRVEAQRSKHVLTEPLARADGDPLALSDHPGVLVELELARGTPEVVAGSSATVTAEAVALLEARIRDGDRARWGLWVLAVLALYASVRFRRRARRIWRGRWRWRLLALAMLVGSVWSAYLAASFWPRHQRDLADVRAVLIRPPS